MIYIYINNIKKGMAYPDTTSIPLKRFFYISEKSFFHQLNKSLISIVYPLFYLFLRIPTKYYRLLLVLLLCSRESVLEKVVVCLPFLPIRDFLFIYGI